MSDTNWAPPTGPPITGRKLDPKMLGLGGGVVAALVIAVVAAMSVGGGGDDSGGDGTGREGLLGPIELDSLGKGPSEEPGRVWEYDGDAEQVRDVALSDKSVFVLAEGPEGSCVLRALSTDDGKQRWSFELAAEEASCGAVAVSDDRVLAGVGLDGDLDTVSLTADKGKEQGRSTIRNAEADTSQLLIDPDGTHAYVLVRDGASRLVRLDVVDARRSWAVEGDELRTGSTGIVLTTPESVAFVDYETGDTLWEEDATDPYAFPAGDVVVVRDGNDLVAYDAEGSKLWTVESAAAADINGGIGGLGGVVLFGDGERATVRSLDDGEEQATGEATGFARFRDGDRLLLSHLDELTRVGRDGDEVQTEQRADVGVRVVGSRNVIVVVRSGAVRALDPESFEEVWSIDEELAVRVVDHEAMVTVDGEKVTYWK